MGNSNKKFLFIVLGLVLVIILFFIVKNVLPGADQEEEPKTSTGDEAPKTPNTNIAFAEDLMEDYESKDMEDIDTLSQEFLDMNYDFSLELFKKILKDENPLYSPTPVYLALGLVANGADEEASQEIIAALNSDETDLRNLNIYYKELTNSLTDTKGDTDLNIANSIWYDEGFKANNQFLQVNKDYYKADAYKTDFREDKAKEVINNWVEKVTNGKIDKMIDEINGDVEMYMFSSIYFDGKWEFPFSKAKTFDGEFYVNGEAIETKMMSNTIEVKNLISEEEEAVLIPYNDDRYEFLALMPKDDTNIRVYVEGLDSMDIKNTISQMEEDRVNYIIPKFEVSYENSLIETLKGMGIEAVFDPSFNSLKDMGQAKGVLYISDMLQKTYIRVDEEGTEAASVVEVEMEAMSLTETINFDRPFMYGIIDKETSLPIFLGIMDDPSKE